MRVQGDRAPIDRHTLLEFTILVFIMSRFSLLEDNVFSVNSRLLTLLLLIANFACQNGRILQFFKLQISIDRSSCNVSLCRHFLSWCINQVSLGGARCDRLFRHRYLTIHKVGRLLRLSVSDLDAMLLHIAIDFLSKTLKFGVLLLQFFFFCLKHGYHVKSYLDFLVFAELHMAGKVVAFLRCYLLLFFVFFGRDHLVECSDWVRYYIQGECRQLAFLSA